MNFLKRYYVLPYLAVLFVVFLYSLYQVFLEGHRPSVFLLVSVCPMLFFMLSLAVFSKARTKRHLYHELIAGLVVSIAAFYYVDWKMALSCFVLSVIGVALYDFWYSPLNRDSAQALGQGQQLSEVSFIEEEEKKDISQLTIKPAIWLFVRGNWCPLCVAQVKELADVYQKISKLGADVFIVSAQSQQEVSKMAKSLSVPMRFLFDDGLTAVKSLGLLHEGGTPSGMIGYEQDTIMPTVLITKPGGEIYYSDLTSNYRVRPEPEELLKALEEMLNV